MATPFLGQITIMAFPFAPRFWAQCNGQLLPINQNQALFSLLGTSYGGNGQTTFALPDMRGRAPVHTGAGVALGERDGSETHSLQASELPQHSHRLSTVVDFANAAVPAGALPAARLRGGPAVYGPAGSAGTAMHPQSIANAGGSQPHDNMQPYSVLNFCIALSGIFPAQS